jgi:phage tail protein X
MAGAGASIVVHPYWEFPATDYHTEASVSVPPPETTVVLEQIPSVPVSPPSDDDVSAEASRPDLDLGASEMFDQSVAVTRVVKNGEGLYRMAYDVYGFATKQVLERIVETNPSITNVDVIPVGMVILFPDVSDLPASEPEPSTEGQ